MTLRNIFSLLALTAVLAIAPVKAQQLTLEQLTSGTFSPKTIAGVHPLNDGERYSQLSPDARQIIARSFKTGEQTDVLFDCGNTKGDGSSFEYHIEGSLNSMTADKGRLYYIRNNDERLYCYDPIADKEKCVCDDKCIDYAVSENSLFYITDDEGRAAGADRVICRADADGETGFHLTEYGNYGAIGFIGDKLGYVIYDEGYGLIDPESDVTISLSMLNNKMVKMKGLYSLPVERDGSLWYIDRSRDRQLVCRDMQSRKEEEKDLYNVTSFYIMEDSMIVSYIEGGVNRLICSRLIEGWEPAALFEGEL